LHRHAISRTLSGPDLQRRGRLLQPRQIRCRIALVRLEDNQPVACEPFATGWLWGQKVWVRAADVLVMPEGALLVSGDYAGAIQRISYRG
jgi:glucose/arabinose dehydrogenase